MENQNYIYLIFSATPLKMGAMIRTLTQNPYNHISVALKEDAKFFFSFARYNLYSPLAGGFIKESRERFFSNDGMPSKIKVYAIPVSVPIYHKVTDRLHEFELHKESYMYNTFSAILLPIGRICRIQNTFTCAEFAADILMQAEVLDASYIEKPITIKQLEILFSGYHIYEGDMPDTDGNCKNHTDLYFQKQNPLMITSVTIRHFFKLLSKLF